MIVERRDPSTLGLALDALGPWLAEMGPVAVLDLETTGLPESRSAEILEIGVVLLDPGAPDVGVIETLVRPARSIPALVSRLTGLVDEDVSGAPRLPVVRGLVSEQLAGRVLVAHQADFERSFLVRDVDPKLADARFLDTQDLLGLVHPDAPDLRLETFTRLLLGREERHRALDDALDAACVLGAIGEGARRGDPRAREARRILDTHRPTSPWLGLLSPASAAVFAARPSPASAAVFAARPSPAPPDRLLERPAADPGAADARPFDFVSFARSAASRERVASGKAPGAEGTTRAIDGEAEAERFLPIGASDEPPVPFELDAILDVLADAERGTRHFPHYRVRAEQLELARDFHRLLARGGIAKLEGGTGVGKSLAYLAVAIPFAMQREREGEREPVVISTRTKLLQDQLLRKDIAAAARFLGHPDLRALSIKGRANYVCERRLGAVLAEARDPALLDEMRDDYAQLEACARLRPQGEVGTVPAALLRRYPRLRELLRSSVATRADQCSREQCAHERRCPFGRHRRALAKAHLIVANHDLLLRWPPDYPSFSWVVMDEGHEVGGVAEEVYALRVRPEDVAERLDELFGAPVRRGGPRRYASTGLVGAPAARTEEGTLARNRRDVLLELVGLGRTVGERADAFGGVELPARAGRHWPVAAELARSAAIRLEALAAQAEREGPARRMTGAGEDADGLPTPPARDLEAEEEAARAIATHAEVLRGAARGLERAFAEDEDDAYVGAFEGLESPWDRWSLVLRPIAPGEAFRAEFLERVEGLAVVSATLFVGGDDHAALGEIGLAEGDAPDAFQHVVGSPFPYDRAMRVVALDGHDDLVEETAQTLATLARTLGGRTLGLFTSLARMRETADRLTQLLAGEGIEVLLPRRASDDPASLVDRFQKAHLGRAASGAVLLGARRFWQGIDVRGDALQAVVIEKLPFDVPTELRRRRDERLRAEGHDPFSRAALGRMLLHLKQMVGRLIRSETDRGVVVIVDARRDRGYFRRLVDALPEGTKVEIAPREDLPRIAGELGLGPRDG
ncbi:MAG: helicase C-terminal domain-containing protein [Myxococcota bacterium]